MGREHEVSTRRTSVDISAVRLLARLLALLLRTVRVARAGLRFRRGFLCGRCFGLAGGLGSLFFGFDAFGSGGRGGFGRGGGRLC